MSEFSEPNSVTKLIGSPPGYSGHDEGGALTERVRRHPYSIILFDEIEKAHNEVLDLFLQIADCGTLTDSSGRTVSFKNCYVILTSNIHQKSTDSTIGFERRGLDDEQKHLREELSRHFRPEFINRVDEVVCFNSLSEENFRSIAELMLNEVKDCLNERNIALSWDDRALDYLVKKGYSVNYGARNLRRLIQKEVEDRVAQKIIESHGLLDSVSLSSEADVLIIR
jgi:ATP-dependent Clp protease ATP-binding subunit ClpA